MVAGFVVEAQRVGPRGSGVVGDKKKEVAQSERKVDLDMRISAVDKKLANIYEALRGYMPGSTNPSAISLRRGLDDFQQARASWLSRGTVGVSHFSVRPLVYSRSLPVHLTSVAFRPPPFFLVCRLPFLGYIYCTNLPL